MGMAVVAEYLQKLQSFAKAQHDSELAYLFRGHANRSWELVPSLHRPGAIGLRTSYNLQRWKRLAAPFMASMPRTEIEWLALAQHYGLPTSLLDWTLNPLAALYFASADTADGDDGCVHMLNPFGLPNFAETQDVDPFNAERKEAAVISLLGPNQRAKAQWGAVTLHPNAGQAPGGGNGLPSDVTMELFVVPSGAKFTLRRALGVLGFNPGSVFADLSLAAADFRTRLGG